MNRPSTLFDDLLPPAIRASATSVKAARRASRTEETRRAILAFIVDEGDFGATDEEIQIALKISGNAERPRRRELEKAGLINASSSTRMTTCGREAMVWVLAGE